MLFVPVVPTPTSSPPPSPRTRELANLLKKVVSEYSAAHPSVTTGEIREAMRLAQASTPGVGSASAFLAVAGVGILVVGLLAGILFLRGGEGGNTQEMMPMALFAIIVFIGLVLVVVKARSR